MENLLSNQEINEVLQFVGHNPSLRNPNMMGEIFNKQRTAVYKVSPKKGLIFIKGDKSTGFNHIIDRHNFGSNHFFNFETKRQTQSQFSIKSIPITNFSTIADDIFKEENKTESNNDLFDKYKGYSSAIGYNLLLYNIIIYKNTKIVHTLYPQKRNEKQKKNKLPFYKGTARYEYISQDFFKTIQVPYIDYYGRERYIVIIRKNILTGAEKTYIQYNSKYSFPVATIFVGESKDAKRTDSMQSYLVGLEFQDFTPLENIIAQIEKDSK